MWKCGYRYLSCEKLHKICKLVPTLQIPEQLVNIWVFSAVSCSFLNTSINFLWTLNFAMTEYRVILLTANFSICSVYTARDHIVCRSAYSAHILRYVSPYEPYAVFYMIHMQSQHNYRFGLITHTNGIMVCILSLHIIVMYGGPVGRHSSAKQFLN